MMINIQEIRKKYPDYDDLSDKQLAEALHAKYYSDIPKNEYYQKIGLSSGQGKSQEQKNAQDNSGVSDYLLNLSRMLNPQGELSRPDFGQTAAGRELKGFGAGAAELPINTANLFPGVNIPQIPIDDKDWLQSGGKTAGEIGSYMGAGELGGAAVGAAKLAPGLAKLLTGSLGRVAGSTAAGAVMSPEDRVGGAESGFGWGLGGELTGGAISMLGKNALQRKLLDYIKKSAEKGKAAAPEEAAQTMKDLYTTSAGKELPVDIGQLTGNKPLSSIYQALNYIPFSGAKDFKPLDTDILKNQIGEHVLANAKINKLGKSLGDPAQASLDLKNELSSAYKKEKEIARTNYDPLNNSDFRLDSLIDSKNPNATIKSVLPNYANASTKLLAQRENLKNIFGSDSDLGGKLISEINKADNVMKGAGDYGLTLPEITTRIQNLGKLSAAAASQGERNTSRLLMGMFDGLKADTTNALESAGKKDLADQLKVATNHYRENVAPFWKDSEIRKTVEDKNYIPKGKKLADSLHDLNNISVMNKLSDKAKNSLLYNLITRGEGTVKGSTYMDAKDIAGRYQKIPVTAKGIIKSYNPRMETYFSKLAESPAAADSLKTLQNKLTKAEQVKPTGSSAKMTLPFLGKIGTTIGLGVKTLPVAFAARKIATALHSPELRSAYLTGNELPGGVLSKELGKTISKAFASRAGKKKKETNK